jgi:tRNA-Thr(GGU) m(6)t(6)A37 methyltransferase TsaA
MIELHPIGTVRSGIKTPSLTANKDGLTRDQRLQVAREEHRRTRELVSEIAINEEYGDLLDGLEGFSHILVLYWPHLLPPERRSLKKVHPMGLQEFPEQGVFATCSPARPNPVLVSAVKLVAREGLILRVQGFEAVDGSPVVDIKPYNPGYFRIESPIIPEWMRRIRAEAAGE